MATKRTHKPLKVCTAALVACMAFTCSAFASDLPTIGATASSEIPGFNRKDDYLIGGNGLNGAGQHTLSPDGFMWLSSGSGYGGVDPDPSVTFDLGNSYLVESLHVWNYNEGVPNLTSRGVNAVTIQYGDTPALGSSVAGITNFAQADGTNTYAGQSFSAFTPFTARYIKFDINSNHGDGNSFYGLSEVAFDGKLANTIAGVTIEDFSSQLSGFGGRLAVHTVDGSGFTALTGVHGTGAETMWMTEGPFESNEGNDVLPSHITFDLEGNYDLDALNVWNYNESAAGNTDRGAKDVEILVASSVGGPFTSLGNFVFDRAPGTATDFGQVISLADLPDADNVRLVRFNITTNHGDGDNVVGLSEVQFSGVVVPEPASVGLLALGGLALLRRRR